MSTAACRRGCGPLTARPSGAGSGPRMRASRCRHATGLSAGQEWLLAWVCCDPGLAPPLLHTCMPPCNDGNKPVAAAAMSIWEDTSCITCNAGHQRGRKTALPHVDLCSVHARLLPASAQTACQLHRRDSFFECSNPDSTASTREHEHCAPSTVIAPPVLPVQLLICLRSLIYSLFLHSCL